MAVKEIDITDNDQTNNYRSVMAERELHILRELKNHKNVVQIIDHIFEKDT